ncbi:MAG TPA: hypothetical protein VEX68_25125 [Bryobacteraceae bacterium]|nr:hypothetical protein [Bryobacteraceae bacterium]
MRIVACCACQFPIALQEAGRLTHSICLVHNFKLLGSIIVELDDVIGEPLTWSKRVYRPAEAPDHGGQFGARGLEMTLHANVEAALAIDLRGIDDRARLALRLDVLSAGAMAALAIDTRRELLIGTGVSVVAEETPIIDNSGEVRWSSVVESRAHRPLLLGGVPR